MGFQTKLGTQLRAAYRERGINMTAVGRDLGAKSRTGVSSLLSRNPRSWAKVDFLAEAIESTFLLVPNDMIPAVEELLERGGYQPALGTATGVARRLVDMITQQVTTNVYAQLGLSAGSAQHDDEDEDEDDDEEEDEEARSSSSGS